MEDRVTLGSVVHRIAEVRGVRVMLDEDLARMFGVGTAVLNQAVHRNAKRFPEEFVFRLSAAELSNLRSQSVISSWGGRRYPPLAFTEHGVLMAATVLRSEQAIEMSVFIVRAFVRLRSIYASHIELTRRLDELDVKVSKQDAELRAIVQAIRQLALPPVPRRHLIGFTSADSRSTGVVP